MLWKEILRQKIPFSELEREQNDLVAKVRANPEKGYLLFSEPEPTFTCGRSGNRDELFWPEATLEKFGATTYQVSRGGKWTYHGPGQIVVYPIVDLKALGLHAKAIRPFLTSFREGTLQFLKGLGAAATPQEIPYGIYADSGKLASFGLHVQSGVVSHGMSLYLRDQSPYFSAIHPCGVVDQPITSLEQLGFQLSWEDAAREIAEVLKNSFKFPQKWLA